MSFQTFLGGGGWKAYETGYRSGMRTATCSIDETRRRSQIFGEVAKAKADVALSLGLSDEGRMAAASPGPGFPDALDLLWFSMRPPPGTRIADLGAGLGGASAWMQARGANVVAYEVEPECVVSGLMLFPDLDLRCADAATADLRSFDAVTAFGLLSLCDDPNDVLRGIADRLVREPQDARPWIASVDLVSTTSGAIVTPRNHFLPLGAFTNALPHFDIVMHHVIPPADRSTLWHDVSTAVEAAVRETVSDEALEVFDADRRSLTMLLDECKVEPALTVFRAR